MNHFPQLLRATLLAVLCMGMAAYAEEAAIDKVDRAIKKGADKAAVGVEKGAEAVKQGVSKGLDATDRAVRKADGWVKDKTGLGGKGENGSAEK